ncbi:MAG: LPS export ABC transporter periplasmic protein LptC [Acidobacteria bacterium]|nr:LPS export ABC transporter periplasmic protein LptC [Acidobacteriota bacterium]
MAFSAARLRRWFALAVALVSLAVVGFYVHARHRVENALRQVPERLNIRVQQTAHGFTISNSHQGRTLFKLEASQAVQFKAGGRTELHDVVITIYGRDSSRFDQIYGKTFDYDRASGNITGKGEVSIDLQSNPHGTATPDQAAPLELKNPIHLKTSNLVFNQKTGDAWTPSLVQFYIPEVSGVAVGAKYDAKQSLLTLDSDVQMTVSGRAPLKIFAERALLERTPRAIVLLGPRTDSAEEKGQADEATLFLRRDNNLDHAIATGHVAIRTAQSPETPKSAAGERKQEPFRSQVTSQTLEVAMGARNQIETAVFSGDVHLRSEGKDESRVSAGKAVVTFGRLDRVTRIRAVDEAKWVEHGTPTDQGGQDLEVTAPEIDLFMAEGNRPSRAETSGPPLIRVVSSRGKPPGEKPATETRVTADRFTAGFDASGQLSQVHGAGHARVVSTATPENHNGPQPDRVTTSDLIDASFRPGAGIETLLQQGHFEYASGTQQAFADCARYTAAEEILVLSGSPRMIDSGMETSANTIRLNRATGEGSALGDVKTTYNDLKPQPDGALLASSDPVHVTAERVTTGRNPGIATFMGHARLWQNANRVEAPAIQFQKEPRVVRADASSGEKVSTALMSVDRNGKVTPVHVVSDHLTYTDSERRAHYQGSVFAQSTDLNLSANQMDVLLAARDRPGPAAGGPASQISPPGEPKLNKIIATGSVVFTQPNRRATGEQLTYNAVDEKFVLTGGPPSIFDAERGKITGLSLTLYRTNDRVIVDGDSRSPAVTETRVER